MKNILEEKPIRQLNGRLRASAELVKNADIKNKRILDIGCGYGWCELNFLDRGAKKIVGIELTDQDLATARKYITDKRAVFKIGSAIDLPFPDKSFDTVVAWEVIEHIPKNTEGKMFQEVSRVLKTNGAFYLSTPYKHILSNILDPAWWLIGHRHYSKTDLEMLGRQSSLPPKNIFLRGSIWSLLGILNMYVSKWILHRKPLLESYFHKKTEAEYSKKSGYASIFCKYTKQDINAK
jgi:SAM-dependent methyltransferase